MDVNIPVHISEPKLVSDPPPDPDPKISFDADVETTPRAPDIPPDEPLPKDLQDLVNRWKNLTPDQKHILEQQLRKHHDVFAKDNTFGRCPLVKFKIDTGDHTPIKMQARPIPLHYRKAVHYPFI